MILVSGHRSCASAAAVVFSMIVPLRNYSINMLADEVVTCGAVSAAYIQRPTIRPLKRNFWIVDKVNERD
jgi:hypothetical protein